MNALKNRSFRGYWLTYQPNIGRVSVGEVGDSHPVIQWTDIHSSRLADADYLGIQVCKLQHTPTLIIFHV